MLSGGVADGFSLDSLYTSSVRKSWFEFGSSSAFSSWSELNFFTFRSVENILQKWHTPANSHLRLSNFLWASTLSGSSRSSPARFRRGTHSSPASSLAIRSPSVSKLSQSVS